MWTSVARLHLPVAALPVRRAEWIAIAWLTLSSLLLLRLMVSWVQLDRRRSRASPVSLGARAERWLQGCPSTRGGVLVCTSTEIAIPTAVGPRHPSILIPARLVDELDDHNLGRIVLHEAAHLARRDDWALLIERLIEALFAFHPVVRWITRQIDLEREVACDDFVVEATGQPRSYASCLMRMVEVCGGVRTSIAGATAAGDRSHLTRRVERLLDKSRHTGTRLLKTRLAAMVAFLAIAAWTVGRTPVLVAFATPSPMAAATAVSTPQPVIAAAMEPPAPQPAPQTAASPLDMPAPLPAVDAQVAPPSPPTPLPTPQPVHLLVEVTDPRGRFVTGLGRENFKVFEDGVEQQISQLVIDDAPISVGIVVDNSGSMGPRQAAERDAVLELLKGARPNDEFFLIPFSDEPKLEVPFTTDTQAIETAMVNLKARGGTALRDAVHMALIEMKHGRNQRRAILILSDGDDNSSGRSAADMRQEVSEADCLIDMIDVSDNPGAPRGMNWILGHTRNLGADNLVNIVHSVSAFATGLRNRYVLVFTSSNPVRDGKYRKLQVEAVPPVGLPPLKVLFPDRYKAGQ
jgi:Ca-activated chloride channel family protein